MIDEQALLEWAESAKKLSKTYSPGQDGKFYYAIDYCELRRQIKAMTGGENHDQETRTAAIGRETL